MLGAHERAQTQEREKERVRQVRSEIALAMTNRGHLHEEVAQTRVQAQAQAQPQVQSRLLAQAQDFTAGQAPDGDWAHEHGQGSDKLGAWANIRLVRGEGVSFSAQVWVQKLNEE